LLLDLFGISFLGNNKIIMQNKVILRKLEKYNNVSEDIEEKYEFYLLDLEIKKILFKYLEILEDSLKAQLVKNIGNDFLDENIFREKFLEKRKKFNSEKIEELQKRYKKIDENIFFMELTFWELVRYFKDLKNEFKEQIIGFYWFRKFSIFESWFFSIRYLRNLVCHWENIFNRNFWEKPLWKKLSKIFNLKTNDFILYIAILEIFWKILKIDNEFLFEKLKKVFNKQKNLPVWGQISKIEIEAWQVFIQQLYSSFIKKSNLNYKK